MRALSQAGGRNPIRHLGLIALVVGPHFLNDFYVIAIDNENLALLWSLDLAVGIGGSCW